MDRPPDFAFNDAARAFVKRLLARHPDWEPFVAPYEQSPRDGIPVNHP